MFSVNGICLTNAEKTKIQLKMEPVGGDPSAYEGYYGATVDASGKRLSVDIHLLWLFLNVNLFLSCRLINSVLIVK